MTTNIEEPAEPEDIPVLSPAIPPEAKDPDTDMVAHDVVIPAFGGDSKSKHRRRFSKQIQKQQEKQLYRPPPSRRVDYLELIPTKETTQMMRQVSGLGMEDPVFGLFSSHSTMARNAAKNMPHVFDDMGLEDIPVDMRGMVSVCSDPTASIAGELPAMSDIFAKPASEKQSRTDKFHLSASSGFTNVTTRLTSSKSKAHRQRAQQESPPAQKRSTRQLHTFVPPKSVKQLQGPEGQDNDPSCTPMPTRSTDLSTKKKDETPDTEQGKKKTLRHRLNKGSSHRSRSFEALASSPRDTPPIENDETELDVEDLGKSRSRHLPQRRHTTSNNKLHSSDSRILFNYQRRRKSQQRKPLTKSQHRDIIGVQGLDVNVVTDDGAGNPVVSGLTTTVPPMEGFDLKLNNDGYVRTVSGLTTALPAEIKAEDDDNEVKDDLNNNDEDNDEDDDEDDDDKSSELVFEEFQVRTVTVDGVRVEVPVLDIKPSRSHSPTLSMDETIFDEDGHDKDKAAGDDNGEGELLELMRSQQSLDFFDLQDSPETPPLNDKNGSNPSKSPQLSFDRSEEKVGQEQQQQHQKESQVVSPRTTPTATRKIRRRSSRSSPKGLTPQQPRRNTRAIDNSDDSNNYRRQKLLSNKITKPELDDSKLFRHSKEKSERKVRRSYSVQDERKSASALGKARPRNVQRRRSNRSPANSKSLDAVAARMLALGTASLQAAEHAEELRSKHQRSFQVSTLIGRSQLQSPSIITKSSHTRDAGLTATRMVSWNHTRSKSKQRKPRRSTSRNRSPSTNFHASVGEFSSDATDGLAKKLLKNLNRSMGNFDF